MKKITFLMLTAPIILLLFISSCDMQTNSPQTNSDQTPVAIASNTPSPPKKPTPSKTTEEEAYVQDYVIKSLSSSSENGDIKAIQEAVKKNPKLVKAVDCHGLTLLHYAATHCKMEIAKFLISKGANVNAVSSGYFYQQESPLACAISTRWVFGCDGKRYGNNMEMIKFLISKGANPKFINNKNRTLLHFSATYGDDKTIIFLISKGLDVNAKDDDGLTPLHEAAVNGNVGVAVVLVKKGASVNAKDKDGNTPIHIAAKKAGAMQTGMGPHARFVKFLISKGADANQKNNQGETPLKLGIKSSESEGRSENEVTELLVKYGGTE